MRKKIIILSVLVLTFVTSCGGTEELEKGQIIDWSSENIDKYIGSEIYCSFESTQSFFANVVNDYSETTFSGKVIAMDNEPYFDMLTPYGDYIEVADDNNGNVIKVYDSSQEYEVGETIIVSGMIIPEFDRDEGVQGYYVNDASVVDNDVSENDSMTVEEAIQKMDRLYKETIISYPAYVRTASNTLYRTNVNGDFEDTADEIDCFANNTEDYNGEWVIVKGNICRHDKGDYGLYNTTIVEK